MKKTNTKRTLILSALSLLLCFSMLIGTTFAWFTDEVSSQNNIIKSGNLDIKLEYSYGDGNWTEFTNNANVLDNEALWEPGRTDVVYFRITNVGSLALKYQFGINIVDEKTSTNVNGEELKLSNFIEFSVFEINEGDVFEDRYEALAAATMKPISEGYTKAESLAAYDEQNPYSVYLAMVVTMPEEVGNAANHKTGVAAPSITLGINLFATQVAAESDSFDEFYDGGAGWTGAIDTTWYDPDAAELTIGTAEQLAGLAAIVNGTAGASTYSLRAAAPIADSFAGQTITLASDIDFKGMAWTPIGNWDNVFEGIFDGNGYTISNLYINAPEAEGVGFFGVAQNATIKNVTFENVDVAGYSMVATVVGSPYTGCTISNCHVTGDINLVAEWAYVGGIMAYGYTDIDNCSVIADETGYITSKTRNAVGGISAWLLEDVSSVVDCEVKNLELTGWANIGAITGFIHRNGVINGCAAENVVMTKTREDGHPTIGLASGGWSYNASKAITVTNNTFKNITLNGTYLAISSADILYGAEYAGSTNSNFVLENNSQEGITNNLVEVEVVSDVAGLKAAMANGGVYALANKVGTEDWVLELTETITVPAGVEVVLYMNGKTIAGTLSGTGNQDLFLVKGDLTINNGTVTLTATQNQGWGAMSSIFDITAGGAVTLENVVAENKGGTDMNFVAHLNNWGTATLNVNNSTLKATYIAVRVFNSGNDKNNVTIKNSTLEGKYSFWVHNYTLADFGTVEKVEKQKQLLNFDIFNGTNKFVATGKAPVMYGFTDEIYFTAEGVQIVETVADLDSLLASGGDVALSGNMNFNSSDTTANSGYGATGVSVKGGVLDGNGYSLGINNWGTWDAAVHTTGGTIKNITINSGMRGIFMGSANANVYIDNVVIDGTIYTFNSDGGNKNYGVYISNSTLNGWTSHSDVHKEVVYTNCDFGEGQGYAFCRPYGKTVFENCVFEEGYELDTSKTSDITFINCYYGETLITAENAASLGIFYNGLNGITIK